MEIKRQKLSDLLQVASTVNIQILSNGTSHMAPCVVLRTSYHCYMFNCPEGLSRFISLIRIRFNHVQDLFVTRDVWENLGGTAGLIMGKDDPRDFHIHGPSTISCFMNALRPSIDKDFGNSFPVNIKEFDNKRDHYEDASIRVNYLQVSNKGDKKYTRAQRLVMNQGMGDKIEVSPSEIVTNVAYLIRLKKCPPHIDTLKLIRLKVPRTSVIAQLKAGETVTLEDGRVIRPEDVIDEQRTDEELPNLLVVDIRSEENLDSISTNPQLTEFYTETRSEQMNYIVHFTPTSVFHREEYKEWLRAFGPECTHLVVNGDGKVFPQSDRVFIKQNMHREIFPEGFPELYPNSKCFEGREFDEDSEELDIRMEEVNGAGPIILPGFLRRFKMRGFFNNRQTNRNTIHFTDRKEVLEERIKETPELPHKIEQFRTIVNTFVEQGPANVYPIVTFLGTGSAQSTLYRNVSANLLQTSESANFLIDCGETTYGQMKTLFGPEECTKLLANLNAIFITHSHQDHFLGLYHVIKKRIEAFQKLEIPYRKLVVISNLGVKKICDIFSTVFFDLNDDYVHFMDWVKMAHEEANVDRSALELNQGSINLEQKIPRELFVPDEWNLRSIRAFQVIHKKWSCGFMFITERERKKIVFSGDTMPCKNLEEHGQNADLLIHECTFEEGMEADARKKKHSTMKQAFDTAVRLGAKNTILTHFSSRYPYVPSLPDYLLEAGNFSCAEDNMVVPFNLLPLFPKILPVYRHLYRAELFEIEQKTIARSFSYKEAAAGEEDEPRREKNAKSERKKDAFY